jgi:signal transduction histidine kinase/DNA-binding response OmpR family regulator
MHVSLFTRLLFWFLIIALLPLLLVTVLSYNAAQTALQDQVTSGLEAVAQGKGRQIERYALERKEDVANLTTMPELLVAFRLAVLETPSDAPPVNDNLDRFLESYVRDLGYRDLLLIDGNGRLFYAADGSQPLNTNYFSPENRQTPLGQVIDRAATLLESEISDFDFSRPDDPQAFIAAPAFYDGQLVGVAVLVVNNAELYRVIGSLIGLDQTGETLVGLQTESGVLVTAPLRSDPQAAFRRVISDPDVPIQYAVQGQQGSGVVQDYRGVEVVAVWRYLPSLRWGMVVKKDTAEAFAPVQTLRNAVLTLTALTFLTVIALAGLVAQSIARPLRYLTEAVQQIAQGNLSARAHQIQRADEIGLLAQGFNRMGDQLQDLVTNLENKVKERTLQAEQARQEAERANQAKSIFLANMSHELRTPMNAILGFAQLMERDTSLSEQHRNNLQIISRSGDHLLSLLNSVLELSKIEAGQSSLHEAPFDLGQMLQSLEEMFRMRAEAKDLLLLFELEDNLPPYIHGDESKLRQILINLLGNALKFTQEGGVTLRGRGTLVPHGQVRLLFEIEDTGTGIAPDELEALFKPFSQTESGVQSQEGTGLGLTISQQFVHLMGGQITVKSILGQGTLFSVEVVVRSALEAEVPRPQREQRVIGLHPSSRNDYRILVVDDRWENRHLMLQRLQRVGIETREAANGQEAINIWEEWEPHLIWMDMRMPVMDGYTATRHIKRSIKGQATVIIALTASAFEQERNIVLSAGCDDFIRKPTREALIFAKMEQFLGMKFLYEDSEPLAPTSTAPTFTLTAQHLNDLTSAQRAALATAINSVDVEALQVVITELQADSPQVAQALQQLANSFRFDYLQELMENTTP